MLKRSFKHSTIALAAMVAIQGFTISGMAQVKNMTIDDVINSLSDNDAIKSAEALTGQARAQIQIAKAGRLPTITASAGPEIANGKYVNAVSLSAVQPIYTGGVVTAQIDAAKHLFEGSQHGVDVARVLVAYNAKNYYFEILKAAATASAQEKAVKAGKLFLAQAKAAQEAGTAGNALDKTAAETAIANAQAAVDQAHYNFNYNCDLLLNVLQKEHTEAGLCNALTKTKPPAQPILTEPQAEQLAIQVRPDLLQQVETIGANADVVKEYGKLSGFSVNGVASETRNTGPTGVGNAFTNVFPGIANSTNDSRVGVNAQYTLDPHRHGLHDNAEYALRGSQIQLDSLQRTVKEQVQNAYANLALANQLSTQATILFQAQKLQYTITKEQVANGQINPLLFVTVIANTAIAETAANTAKLTIGEAINQVQDAIGQVTSSNMIAGDESPVDRNALP